MTDITDTLAPNSDQLDAIDLHHSGPRTFTVERVVVNKTDQPVNITLREFPRVWRPSKNMRRVLADCWGVDSSAWTGRRVTLYFDAEVTFGKEKPGGIRVSHVSGIDGPRRVPIIVSRGKSGLVTVQPLPDAPAPAGITLAGVAQSTNPDQLREAWKTATPDVKAAIEARVTELKAGA